MRTSIPLIASLGPTVPLILAVGAFAVAGAQAANLPEVTVTAPTAKVIGRDASGAPIRQLTATARVRYNPIMLTTNSGRALLQYKVTEVARNLCRKLDTMSPTMDEGTCVEQAVAGAKVQIAAAVARQNAG